MLFLTTKKKSKVKFPTPSAHAASALNLGRESGVKAGPRSLLVPSFGVEGAASHGSWRFWERFWIGSRAS